MLVFKHTFSGTTYVCAIRSGVRGWVLISYGTVASAVIVSAFTYVSSVGGGNIIVCRGHYILLAGPTLIPSNTMFFGEGRNVTVFDVGAGLNFHAFYIYTNSSNVVVQDLGIVGNATTRAAAGRTAIRIYGDGCFNILLSRLKGATYYDGLVLVSLDTANSHWIVVHACYVTDFVNSGISFAVNAVFYHYYVTISSNLLDDGIYPIFLRNGRFGTIENNEVKDYGELLDVAAIMVSAYTGSEIYHINILNNKIRDSQIGFRVHGILISCESEATRVARHIIVLGNQTRNITGVAYYLHGFGTDGNVSLSIVANNTADLCWRGISFGSIHDTIVISNTFSLMSGDGIIFGGCDDCSIDCNVIVSSTGYDINLDPGCNRTRVGPNLLTGAGTGRINDTGIDTKLPTLVLPFLEGGDAAGIPILAQFISADGSAKGWQVDAANEWAIALGHLPFEVQQVVRIKVWAVGLAAPGAGNKMLMELLANGAQRDEPFNTENIAVVNKISNEINFAVNDVVSWTFTSVDDADIGDLVGGDNLEVKAKYNAAVAADIATNAVFRCVEIQYV